MICVGGILKYSTISNNIVTDLPIITGDLAIPTTKFDWRDVEISGTASTFYRYERSGIHNFTGNYYPRDWFFSFVSAGHGWRDNTAGEEYLTALGTGCNEISNTIIVGSSVSKLNAEKEEEEEEPVLL